MTILGLLFLLGGIGLLYRGRGGRMTQQGCLGTLVGLALLLGGVSSCGPTGNQAPTGKPVAQVRPVAKKDASRLDDEWRRKLEAEAAAQEAREVQEKTAKAEKERLAQEELAKQIAADKDELARNEAERAEVEMVRYELAKAEHHAASKLRFGRTFLTEARREKQAGRIVESDRLMAKALKWFNEVIKLYAETEAAADARQLVAGKEVPERSVPPAPALPKGLTAHDHDVREKEHAAEIAAKPSAGGSDTTWSPGHVPAVGMPVSTAGRSVYVRGYTRKDGTHVRPHYRSPPGSGRSRGR